jgi:cysteine desulfurase
MRNPIYLDNNATTAVDPAVFDAMVPWLRDHYGNPSSIYASGRAARSAVEEARSRVATLIDARPEEIFFTSCGTESINTAILSACSLDPDRRRVITSAVEHSATLKLCDSLARKGYEIVRLGVDKQGHVSLDELAGEIDEETCLVSLLWANNETGVLNPVEEIAALCLEKGVPLHLDAVQVVGKLPVSVQMPGLSFLSLSGHKLHAPKGIGAIYASRRVRFTPLLRGSQEEGRRGGTENVASIVAMGFAAGEATKFLEEEQTRVRALRDRFECGVLETIEGVAVNGDREKRLPNTTNLAFEGIEAEGALMLLDQAGVCCSAGSACTAGSVSPSHVLQAMGLDAAHARASLRFSFGRFNTEEETTTALQILAGVVEKLRRESPRAAGPVLRST